jgi:hypothetical protein
MVNQKKKRTSKKKKAKKKSSARLQLTQIIISILILLILVVVAGWLLRQALLKNHPLNVAASRSIHQKANSEKFTFEVYPKQDVPSAKQKSEPVTPFSGHRPKIGIILDDVGYDIDIVKKFLAIDSPITLSILPQSPYQKQIVALARDAGCDIMLHLPMEPKEYPAVNPGPGTLLTTMSADELIGLLKKDLDEIPIIKGVNNHMGSKMTTEAEKMRQIFSVLKKRGLFFIDSRTTAQTICKASAQLLHVPFEERDVFIDHKRNGDFIHHQMEELLRIAKAHGKAIGIAHPHKSTVRVLSKMIPEMEKIVMFVPVSELVN